MVLRRGKLETWGATRGKAPSSYVAVAVVTVGLAVACKQQCAHALAGHEPWLPVVLTVAVPVAIAVAGAAAVAVAGAAAVAVLRPPRTRLRTTAS